MHITTLYFREKKSKVVVSNTISVKTKKVN